ncbi:MAG TPA: hypothetical protein VMT52_01770 [Planctomycetota bacterium]|nr:hypothetical protein [Planctomycetota bacterium]
MAGLRPSTAVSATCADGCARAIARACVLGTSLSLAVAGCCAAYVTPESITLWQDPSPPALSLAEKAGRYQTELERLHLTKEGILRYRIDLKRPEDPSYGNLADGSFHTGIYLSSQALRFAVTREPAAREQVLKVLDGLRILMEVTGKHGLLARHITPAGTLPLSPAVEGEEGKWRPSATHPELFWRGDVSKDQYAGFIHGLGVTLAVVKDPEVRARVADLAGAAADHLIENHLQIIDTDGSRTTFGDLQGHAAFVPLGINALIALAIAKVAAESTGEERHAAFYRNLLDRGYVRAAYWARIPFVKSLNRVNDNMAYLALYPLLLLEKDAGTLNALREAEGRSFGSLRDERNAFFALTHAVAWAGDPRAAAEGRAEGREALLEFPDDKIARPVDLTRPGFDFPIALKRSKKCEPRSKRAVPLYLRPRGSCFWVSDPYRLVGNLTHLGDTVTSGQDYLLVYWIARHHGIVAEGE